MEKKVSILMSVYFEENSLLGRCIDAICSQSYENFEFIIVNDKSSEENKRLLDEYRAKDPRIKILNNDENLGLTKSLNKAADFANGEYLARIDSDDFCETERLQEQVNFLESEKEYVLCGTKSQEIIHGKQVAQSVSFFENNEQIRRALTFMNPMIHSSIMMRKDTFKEIGGYDESFRYAQDYQLVYQFSKRGKLKNINRELVVRTVDENRISSKKELEQLICSIRTRLMILKDTSVGLNLKIRTIYSLLKSSVKVLLLKVKRIVNK